MGTEIRLSPLSTIVQYDGHLSQQTHWEEEPSPPYETIWRKTSKFDSWQAIPKKEITILISLFLFGEGSKVG